VDRSTFSVFRRAPEAARCSTESTVSTALLVLHSTASGAERKGWGAARGTHNMLPRIVKNNNYSVMMSDNN
jgi:hypothetical protein